MKFKKMTDTQTQYWIDLYVDAIDKMEAILNFKKELINTKYKLYESSYNKKSKFHKFFNDKISLDIFENYVFTENINKLLKNYDVLELTPNEINICHPRFYINSYKKQLRAMNEYVEHPFEITSEELNNLLDFEIYKNQLDYIYELTCITNIF